MDWFQHKQIGPSRWIFSTGCKISPSPIHCGETCNSPAGAWGWDWQAEARPLVPQKDSASFCRPMSRAWEAASCAVQYLGTADVLLPKSHSWSAAKAFCKVPQALRTGAGIFGSTSSHWASGSGYSRSLGASVSSVLIIRCLFCADYADPWLSSVSHSTGVSALCKSIFCLLMLTVSVLPRG